MEQTATQDPPASSKKVDRAHARIGSMGEMHLASGKNVGMRLWEEQPGEGGETMHARPYETVGYVINGEATLHLPGETITLEAGDSWVVPSGVEHRYQIDAPFAAVEATSPPARLVSSTGETPEKPVS